MLSVGRKNKSHVQIQAKPTNKPYCSLAAPGDHIIIYSPPTDFLCGREEECHFSRGEEVVRAGQDRKVL